MGVQGVSRAPAYLKQEVEFAVCDSKMARLLSSPRMAGVMVGWHGMDIASGLLGQSQHGTVRRKLSR